MAHDYLSDQMFLETEQEQDFSRMSYEFTSQLFQSLRQFDLDQYKTLTSSDYAKLVTPYIGGDFEVLKLYMAVHAADCTRVVTFSGVPKMITENLKKQAFVQITKARTQKELVDIIEQLFKDLMKAHEKYGIGAYSQTIRRAVEYIQSRRFQPLSAGDVARHLHVERTSLSKRFHRETGQTITDYIHTMKMDAAEEMIHSRNYSLLEVSDLLGYSSYNYFCKVYKKYKHCAPSDPY